MYRIEQLNADGEWESDGILFEDPAMAQEIIDWARGASKGKAELRLAVAGRAEDC